MTGRRPTMAACAPSSWEWEGAAEIRNDVGAGGDAGAEPAPFSRREARVTLGPDTSSVGAARSFLRRTLELWGSTGMTETATLLTSELVTNAILHARCSPEVVVRLLDSRLRVEVHDSNPLAPALKRYGLYAGTGRGIGLVDELAAAWGSTPGPEGGKSVWFELDGNAPTEGARLLDAETLADLADLAAGSGPAGPARGASDPGPRARTVG